MATEMDSGVVQPVMNPAIDGVVEEDTRGITIRGRLIFFS